MQLTPYKQALQDAVSTLVAIREQLFDTTFQVAVTGELKEWSDTVAVGESITMPKEVFASCDDKNVQMLTALMTQVEQTCDSLLDLNNLEIEE